MKYDKQKLNKIAQEFDLLSYAEKTMDFKGKGKDFFTHCPLHVDNTPSLSISTDVNKWYCHSCHRGGNIYNWLMTFENLSFQEAVVKVAGDKCICYSESDTVSIYKELRECAKLNIEKQISRKKLDFQNDYIKKYVHEYPDEWLEEGITRKAMDMYEILIDRISNRIVYPVYDQNGVFISVKGRTRFTEYKALKLPKYINMYPIGTTDFLQGWKQAEESIRSNKKIIIFEGVKSCMKAYGWGIYNTVASETSDLSDGQMRLLIKEDVSEVIIAWDKDKQLKDIVANDKIKLLKRFKKVSVVYDNKNLLEDKMAPVDMGEMVFRELLQKLICI